MTDRYTDDNTVPTLHQYLIMVNYDKTLLLNLLEAITSQRFKTINNVEYEISTNCS